MNVKSQLATMRSESLGLTLAERAALACRLAKQFERAGEYEAACEALEEFWPERTQPPTVEGLDDATKAEVLLRVGALAGWLGGSDQIDGSQEAGKNLITRSIEIFEELGDVARVVEAQSDLALCYFREGSYNEARIHLTAALKNATHQPVELKAVALIRAGEVEVVSGQLNEALHYYNEAASMLAHSEDHALKGALHNEFARVFRRFGREQGIDRALIEYSAAGFHFEQAGNIRFLARVEHNLGFLFFTLGKYDEAHKHLDRARHLFLDLKDDGMIARVDEARARTLLAEGRVGKAERVARYAVRILERGDEHAILAEALTTYGVIQARLAKHAHARKLLDRAISTAETAGDVEGAGRAKLSIIEELSGQTPDPELLEIWFAADELLRHSQDPATIKRLLSSGRKLLRLWTAEPPEVQAARVDSFASFSIKEALHKTERAVVERALKQAGGSVSRAAYLLGYKHHQSLISIINLRHPDLRALRSEVRKRRVPLAARRRRGRPRGSKSRSVIRILQIEDNEKVAAQLGEMFGAEEWRVDLCKDGAKAVKKLAGKERYDVLLIDNDLADFNGLAFVSQARSLKHRRRAKIIMLSEDEMEAKAFRAGVDQFLRKPQDLPKVPATIARLLNTKLKAKST